VGRDFDIVDRIIQWPDGRDVRFEMALDITERKRAEDALRDSQARFKMLFEGASTAIFIIDLKTRTITDCNTYASRLIGRPKEEIIGMHHASLHPPDRLAQCRGNAALHSPDGRVANFETEILHRDGRRIPIFINSTIMEIDGRKIMMGSYLDVTDFKLVEKALRESEERYRRLVENIQVLVWEVDENYRYTYMNPRFRDVLGYEPEELLGKTPFELMAGEEVERIMGRLKPLLDEHKPFELLDYLVLRKDGEKVYFKTNAVPVFDDKGRFKGYRGVNRDITDGRG